MPNHCENNLTINGDAHMIKKFYDENFTIEPDSMPQTGMHKRGTAFLPNNASKRVRHLSGRWNLAVLRRTGEGWEGLCAPEAADTLAA